MRIIEGEVWLRLADGRLISIHRGVADGLIAAGARLIPPERVEEDGGGGFRLLPEPPETATLAPPSNAMRTHGRPRQVG